MRPIQVDTTIFAHMRAAFDIMNQGCMLLDRRRRVAGFNSRLVEILGLAPGVMRLGACPQDLIKASTAFGDSLGLDMAEVYGTWSVRPEDDAPATHLGHRPDGRTFRVAYAPFGEGGWIVTFEDISERIEAERALAWQSERFDSALATAPRGVCAFDAENQLILCNASYAALYRLPPELTVAGTPLRRILDHRAATGSAPTDIASHFHVADETETTGDVRSGPEHLQDSRTIRIAVDPMIGGGYFATHQDITATAEEEKIRYLGSHDALTGLPNGSLLRSRIDLAVSGVRRGETFAIHHLELDKLKSVNDAHGKAVGDLLLRRVVKRLRRFLRNDDTFSRIAAHQFVVLQAGIKRPEQAGRLARRLVEVMAEPFDFDGRQMQLSVSVGVSIYPKDGVDADTLLKNAASGLLRSKSEGRNNCRFFDPSTDDRLQRRRQIEVDLRRAVVDGEFELYYQPQVNALTQAITGCEALLRWNHPSRGIIAPGEFIPVAEETGVIVPLGAWVIHQACQEAATWPKTISVAVNLSSAQFKGLALLPTVVAALVASGLSPLRLELEITESALLTDSESTIDALRKLRSMGVRIAMDDFGTGYSSLSYLRSFQFDKVKIDRSFIKDIDRKRVCSAIVRAMANLGAELGMTVTAEGVETLDQLRLVRDHGCNEAQGYFFGRPCPATALREILGIERDRGRVISFLSS